MSENNNIWCGWCEVKWKWNGYIGKDRTWCLFNSYLMRMEMKELNNSYYTYSLIYTKMFTRTSHQTRIFYSRSLEAIQIYSTCFQVFFLFQHAFFSWNRSSESASPLDTHIVFTFHMIIIRNCSTYISTPVICVYIVQWKNFAPLIWPYEMNS